MPPSPHFYWPIVVDTILRLGLNPYKTEFFRYTKALNSRAVWWRPDAGSHAAALAVKGKAMIGASDAIIIEGAVGQWQKAMPALVSEGHGLIVFAAKDN